MLTLNLLSGLERSDRIPKPRTKGEADLRAEPAVIGASPISADTTSIERFGAQRQNYQVLGFAFSFTFPPCISIEYSTAWHPYCLRISEVFC